MEMEPDNPNNHDQVLVAILKHPHDLQRVRDQGWYRIPLATAPPRLSADYLAFYQTAAFGSERWSVRFYAPILRYRLTQRRDLLPDEPHHPRANEPYYCLELGTLNTLPVPVPAARLRRITFISTTFGQLCRARDIRELWSPQETWAHAGEGVWGAGLAGHSLVAPATAH